MSLKAVIVPAALAAVLVVAWPAAAQIGESQDNSPDPIPPPLPKPLPPKDAPKYDSILDQAADVEWGLPEDVLAALRGTAAVYEDYARRFVCDEEARLADYDESGQVSKEKTRRYGYLLQRGTVGDPVLEFRQNIGKGGEVKGEVEDSEPFPPAYAWVFLFSKFYEPYVDFRLVDKRFEGFDLVYEIHFRGSVPFSDGKDIRQWQGRVLVDAFYFTPIELEAEPVGQKDRLEALYRLWSQSFNLLGFRTGKKPLGYYAYLTFGFKKGDLRFPTSLRYDTHRAVAPEQLVIVSASTRSYSEYRFTGVEEEPRIGGVVDRGAAPSPAPPPGAPAP
jgi:hypothetical protein